MPLPAPTDRRADTLRPDPAPVRCAMREELVRETAYALWERAGHPAGHDVEHWLQAEAEVLRMAHDGAAPHGQTPCSSGPAAPQAPP